jgi:hypothetical protein
MKRRAPEPARGSPGHARGILAVTNESAYVTVLWAAYLFLLPVHRVWSLPWFGTKLQPPELVLVVLAAVAVVWWWRGRVVWRPVAGDAAAGAWLLANFIAVVTLDGNLRFTDSRALTEALGAVSLVGLYTAVRLTATSRLLDRAGEWIGLAAVVAAALGLAGVALAWCGVPTRLATVVMTLVPYLENAPRAQAFTAGPQMLASILLLAGPLFVGNRLSHGWRRRDTAVILLIALALVATLSKSLLCAAAAAAVMWASGRSNVADGRSREGRRRAWLAAGVCAVVVVVYTAGSHLMLVRSANVERWRVGQVVAGQPVAAFGWSGDTWLLMPTTYLHNKEASLRAIEAAWPAGVGPGQQPAFTARLQRDGLIPTSVWMTTPHSTFLGPVAELGAAGLVALGLLLLAGGLGIRRLLRSTSLPRWEAAAYAGAGAAFLIEAISTDLLNCRHYWWLFAIIAARQASGSRLQAPGGVRVQDP